MISPIYSFVISITMVALFMIQSVQSEKILKWRLLLSGVQSLIFVAAIFTYEEYIKKESLLEEIYHYISIANFVILIIAIYSMFTTTSLRQTHYQLFIKSLQESKWSAYYVVDKKERIIDISQSLLDELDFQKEEVKGKKLFRVFNKSIRFLAIDDKEINNKNLEIYYENFRENAKANQTVVQDLTFLNARGEQVILHSVLQPVFIYGKYRGRVLMGEKKTDFDLMAVERSLDERSKALESIQHKFIATLEISEEGLFYIDLDERMIWASDTLVKTLKLKRNTMDLVDFRRLIEASDLQKYKALLSDLSIKKQFYSANYRILVEGQYMWFKEKGKRLFDDSASSIIMGTLNPIQNKHFQTTHLDILDQLKDKNELIVHMHQLFNKGKYFELALLNLKNIPKINDQYGRDIGNMLMGEYIKKLKQSFVSESGALFRVGGIEFALILTDPIKMDIFKQGIHNNPNFLNLEMNYGSLHTELLVFAGVATGGSDAQEENKLYEHAKQALKVAENPQFDRNGCYYKDII